MPGARADVRKRLIRFAASPNRAASDVCDDYLRLAKRFAASSSATTPGFFREHGSQHANRGARRHVSPRRDSYAPEYRAVVDAFIENFRVEDEVGAACSIVLDGRTVVDIWGGWRDGAKQAVGCADDRLHDVGRQRHHGDLLQHADRSRPRRSERARHRVLARVRPQRQREDARAAFSRPHRGRARADDESALAGRDVRSRSDRQGARGAGAAVGDRHEGGVSRSSSGLPARRDHAPRHRQDRRAVLARGSRDAAARRVLHRRHDRRAAVVRRRGHAEHGGEALRRERRRRSNLAAGPSRSSRTRTSRGP